MLTAFKNLALVFILSFYCLLATAQEADVQFFSSTKLIPKLRPDMQELKAKEYVVGGKFIKDWHWAKKSPNILITLASDVNASTGASKLVSFNLPSSKANWQRQESSNFRLHYKGNTAGLQSKRRTTFIDLTTGNTLWFTRKVFLMIGPNGKKIYTAKRDGSDDLEYLAKECNSTNGDELNRFPLDYNIDHTLPYRINDSLEVICSNGFYAIESRSGLQWNKGEYYDEIKSRENKKLQMAAIFGGALGVLIASQSIKTDLKIYGKHNSAAVSDNGRHYFFNRSMLFSVDSIGHILWEIPAPSGMRGDCGIKINKDTLFYYSMFTPRKDSDIPISKFYAVNKNSGSLIVKGDISVDGSKINDLHSKNGALFAAENNRIKKYEGPTYNFSKLLQINLPKKVSIYKFIADNYYYQGKESVQKLESDSSKVFFIASNQEVYAVDHNLTMVQPLDKNKVLLYIGSYNGFTVLQGTDKVLIIDQLGKEIAGYSSTGTSRLQDNILISNGPSNLFHIDLAQLK